MGKTLRSPIRRNVTLQRPPGRPSAAVAASAPFGLKVFSPVDRHGLQLVLDGAYDVPELSFDAPPVVLDVGANVGAATIWFAKRYPGCTIHAYEPHPDNIAAFLVNTTEVQNVTMHAGAVVGLARWGATTTLFDGQSGPGQRSIYRLGEQKAVGVTVKTIAARDLPPADLLKIDTEGCEVEILEGYAHLAGVKAVLLEWHRLEDYKRLLTLLPQQGLRLVKDVAHGRWIADRELFFVRV